MQKLLTIIVPVYKVEPYINKCLDSLILEDDKLMNQLESCSSLFQHPSSCLAV